MKANSRKTLVTSTTRNSDGFGGQVLSAAPSPARTHDEALSRPKRGSKDPADDAALTSNLRLSHGWGCTACAADNVQSFALPQSKAGFKAESSDRVVYKMGKRMCVYDAAKESSVFLAENKHVSSISHFHVSPHHNHLVCCESTKTSEHEAKAQISVYSLTTLDKLHSYLYDVAGEFNSACFCAESKYVAIHFINETENKLILYNWKKEILFKSVSIPLDYKISKLHCPSTSEALVSTSSSSLLKLWYVGHDQALKSHAMTPVVRDKSEKVIDHIWLRPVNNFLKLAVLTEIESVDHYRKIFVNIFDSQEECMNRETFSQTPHYECKQTILISTEQIGNHNLRVNRVLCTNNGFFLIGNHGYISKFVTTEDKKVTFVEAFSLRIGDEENLTSGTVLPAEDRLVVYSEGASRAGLISVPLGSAAKDQDTEPADVVSPNSVPADLTANGYHSSGVAAASIASHRPIVVTISSDCSARVWNYVTKKCEFLVDFEGDEPRAVAVHFNGLQVLVSFRDEVRLYNILRSSFRQFRSAYVRTCQHMKFSSGCQFWAGASGLNVVVYDTNTFARLASFPGHLQAITDIVWAPGDQAIFSCSANEGNVYAWDVESGNRVNITVSNNQSSIMTALVVIADKVLFPQEGQSLSDTTNLVAYSTKDGKIKINEWYLNDFGYSAASDKPRTPFAKDQGIEFYIPGSLDNFVTAFIVTNDRLHIVAGTNHGELRLYKWDPPTDSLKSICPFPFIEKKAHSGKVVAVMQTPIGSIVSVGEDGTVFLWDIEVSTPIVPSESPANSEYDHARSNTSEYEDWKFNTQVVCLSTEEVEDYVTTLDAQSKQLVEVESKMQYVIRKLEMEHADKMRGVMTENMSAVSAERHRYETLMSKFNEKINSAKLCEETKDLEHVKIVVDLENKFERKLSEQLDRYDAQGEEMELMVQHHTVMREQLEMEYKERIRMITSESDSQMKKLRAELSRKEEERRGDEKAFKETLDQQEYEYEDELKTLIGAAAQKLKEEKEAHDAIRDLTKAKLAKNKNIAEKLKDANAAKAAVEAKSRSDSSKILRLNETIEHYKKNLSEREEALAEKEKIILDLRNTTKTLENFRFVLDHRLQQLTAERGPITSHIEGLEKHVTAMYEELVLEFKNQKYSQVVLEAKDQKMLSITSELGKLKNEVKVKEDYIAAFKRELSTLVSANMAVKEFEEAVNLLYKKYVIGESAPAARPTSGGMSQHTKVAPGHRDEDDSADEYDDDGDEDHIRRGAKGTGSGAHLNEASIMENVHEADRRRMFVESTAKNLKHRLSATRKQATMDNKVRLAENSSLMYECNDLRWQVKELERRLQTAEAELAQSKKLRKDQFALSSENKALTSSFLPGAKVNEGYEKSAPVFDGIRDFSVVSDGTFSKPVVRNLPKLNRVAKSKTGDERMSMKLNNELRSISHLLEEAYKEKELYRQEAAKLKLELRQALKTYSEKEIRNNLKLTQEGLNHHSNSTSSQETFVFLDTFRSNGEESMADFKVVGVGSGSL